MKYRDVLDLIRFDKPVGVMLLFFPCAFGIALNANSILDYKLLIPFFIGSFLMRSSGCIINDLIDKNYDIKVERTKTRPIASGKISPIQAILICVLFSLCGLSILLLFSLKTIIFTFLSIPLVILYPLMKRFTFFPQIFLGFTFNFGILVASMELAGKITAQSVILYIGAIFWTSGYDTIYGFMDIKDDKKIGVKSLSIFIEKKGPKFYLIFFYILFVLLTYISVILTESKQNIVSLTAVIFLICQLSWQIFTLNIDNPINCLYKFKSNMLAGLLAFAFISLSRIYIL